MTIRASLYDFFAYTLPGVFYLLVAVYAVHALGFASLDLGEIQGISIVAALALLGVGYLTGMVMDYPAEFVHRPFNRRGTQGPAYKSLTAAYPHFAPKFASSEWAVALAHVRVHAENLAIEIDRFMAYRIMLRNVGLGLLLLAIANVAASFSAVWPWGFTAAAAAGSIILAFAAGRKAAQFKEWYYQGTFAGVVACGTVATDLLIIKSDVDVTSSANVDIPAAPTHANEAESGVN